MTMFLVLIIAVGYGASWYLGNPALIYVAATLLIREKPLIYRGREEEFEFWRRRDFRDRRRH